MLDPDICQAGNIATDLFDLIWNVTQDNQLNDLRGRLDRARVEQDLAVWDLRKVKELAEENLELKLRLGLLVRLLVSKNVITASEYARLIAEARPKSH